MQFKSNIPIYLQVVDEIKKQIVNGSLKPGEKLPSARELAGLYTINPNTAARVYNELELQHITFTRRGLGTFVTEDLELLEQFRQEMANALIDEFLTHIYAIGYPKEALLQKIEEKYETEKGNKLC